MLQEIMSKNVPRDRKFVFGPSSFMSFKYVSKGNGMVPAKDFIDCCVKHTLSLGNTALREPRVPSAMMHAGNKVPINQKELEDIRNVRKDIISELDDSTMTCCSDQ
jgi:hypothetical protein